MQNRGYIKLMLPFLIISYLVTLNSITKEKHFHVMPDGSVVYHIHPIDKEQPQPLKNHSHSGCESDYFNCNPFDFQETLLQFSDFTPSVQHIENYRQPCTKILARNILNCISLRAPPVV
jgi:hypothetical protein